MALSFWRASIGLRLLMPANSRCTVHTKHRAISGRVMIVGWTVDGKDKKGRKSCSKEQYQLFAVRWPGSALTQYVKASHRGKSGAGPPHSKFSAVQTFFTNLPIARRNGKRTLRCGD